MRRRFGFLFACFFIAAPSIGWSDRYESTLLFRKGAWEVELTHDTSDGELWCNAETTNNRGQTFAITAFQSSRLALFVFDQSWNIPKRPVRFLVDIDYSRWVIDGTGEEFSVSLNLTEPDKAIKFLSELMAGRAVSVLNSDERRLAVFSLSGSYAAVTELFECWSRISKKDPFTSNSDPFAGPSDPF